MESGHRCLPGGGGGHIHHFVTCPVAQKVWEVLGKSSWAGCGGGRGDSLVLLVCPRLLVPGAKSLFPLWGLMPV